MIELLYNILQNYDHCCYREIKLNAVRLLIFPDNRKHSYFSLPIEFTDHVINGMRRVWLTVNSDVTDIDHEVAVLLL